MLGLLAVLASLSTGPVAAQSVPPPPPASTSPPPPALTPAPGPAPAPAATSPQPESQPTSPHESAAERSVAPSAAPAPPVISAVRLGGKLARGDSTERVLRFLDIRSPTVWDDQLQSRVRHDLDALAYQADISLEGGTLVISVRPMRVVRRLYVTGNWPIFEWEILSYLTWRTGYRLPEGDALFEDIRRQERELVSFLNRSGYYDATAAFQLAWEPDSPEQVDVRVSISLNVGFWRLRYNVGEVRAQGVSLLSHRELVDFFDHCCLWVGRTSTERINEDFKRLLDYYQGKGYAGARVLRRDITPDPKRRHVNISFEMEEKKRIVLSFAGRRAVSEGDLRGAVTIFKNNYYSAAELDESARNIYRVYQQRGFLEARVRWRWKKQGGDPLEVEFVIHEGPQLKVRAVDFLPGASSKPLSFPPGKLAEQTRTRVYPRLGAIGLGEGGFASAVQLAQDVQHLTDFYRSQGFPEARVQVSVARSQQALDNLALLGAQTVIDDGAEAGDLFVRFAVDEGRRETVAGVEVQVGPGSTLTEAQVRKVLLLKPGSPYTAEALLEERQRLKELVSASGHPYAGIDPTHSTWNPEHTRVTLRWELTPGELVRFGPILIRGNAVTLESVIRRDLPFRTGDPYDSQKLLEGQQNLIGRQIFSSVRVIPKPGETDEYRLEALEKGWPLSRNPVPVLVEVIERYDNSGELALYAGVSTDNPVLTTASYTWRNMLGTGAEVELRGELGVRLQYLLARVATPRLGSPFLRLDLSGFWRNENTYTIGQVTSYGARAELTRFVARTDEQGRRLPPSLRLYGRLEFNISQIVVPLYRPEGTTEVTGAGDSTQSLKLAFGVIWDRRVGFEAPELRLRNRPVPPNPLMPVAGFRLSAQGTVAMCCTFDASSFSLRGSFLGFEGQAIWLKPFGPELRAEDGWYYGMRRFNFRLNMRLSYGYPLFTPALPSVEKFFAGGDTSTRGYDTGALKAEEIRAPLSPLPGSDIAYRVNPQGGNIRFLSQLEWEFAITPKIAGWPWVGALFLDTGSVFDKFERLSWNDVRFSVGVSVLRLLTQFGALSLDYAYPLTLPGQDPLLQSDRWKREPWYSHFPGRIHFNWGMPISL
ncbi:MAG: POTRA domain-containing protein [Polyangia bacterium]